MADSSRRAAAAQSKGGLPNAMFLVGAADDLPGPLAGRVDLLTIALPWGSLLRGVLTADQALVSGMTGLLRPTGEIELLVSASDRDAAAHGVTLVDEADAVDLSRRLECVGLQIVECRLAVESDVERLSSGWGRRLGIPARRRAWLLRAKRGPAAAQP